MENTKPVKKSITDKQKVARLANLEAGRKKRAEMLQKKKKEQEYDLSSNESEDSDSESEDESFVVSKRRPAKKPKPQDENNQLKQDVNDLKNMVVELATLQKKQNKELKKTRTTKSSGTKVVVVQPNQPEKLIETNSTLEALRRSLGM